MDAPRTPDALSTTEDNELLCEKLLGWEVSSIIGYWFPSQDHAGTRRTPSFDTWADAGLILDALAKRGVAIRVGTSDPCMWGCWLIEHPCQALATTAPNAIRAAALEYIRSLP
jgi:hypothetical protein